MFVSLKAKPEHGFDQPLGLMSDWHRRVQMFLGLIHRVVGQASGRSLEAEEQEALRSAIRYFRTAAPKHTADEEESLFPRLRHSSDPRTAEALRKIEALEADHVATDRMHKECDGLLQQWMAEGSLPPQQTERPKEVVRLLQAIYARHIATEDDEVFPLAAAVLEHQDLRAIGDETPAVVGSGTGRNPPRAETR